MPAQPWLCVRVRLYCFMLEFSISLPNIRLKMYEYSVSDDIAVLSFVCLSCSDLEFFRTTFFSRRDYLYFKRNLQCFYIGQWDYVFVFVCLSVSRITQKVVYYFLINFFRGEMRGWQQTDFGFLAVIPEILPLLDRGKCGNIAGSAALAEVCALRVLLVIIPRP